MTTLETVCLGFVLGFAAAACVFLSIIAKYHYENWLLRNDYSKFERARKLRNLESENGFLKREINRLEDDYRHSWGIPDGIPDGIDKNV